jgi:hypothetical protein
MSIFASKCGAGLSPRRLGFPNGESGTMPHRKQDAGAKRAASGCG